MKIGSSFVLGLLTIDLDGGVSVKGLGRLFNGPGFSGKLYIASDESYVIVSTEGTRAYGSELYISFRRPDLRWTVSVSLGPRINNCLARRWWRHVTLRGEFLFCTHGTRENDCAAVYWVGFDKLLGGLRPGKI